MLLRNILDEKIGAVQFKEGLLEKKIEKICRDHRDVQEGDVFFCLSADEEKAKDFCKQAEERGASVVISQFELMYENAICVDDVREVFAHACANYYDRACDELRIIGVTGTNGKTTITHLVASVLNKYGKKAAVIGTNGVFFDGKAYECPLTTPDADFLHKTFFELRNKGAEFVVMEVSAHAIEQKRINGINFEIGVLTNITQDHLDYFKTFENYKNTKLKFLSKQHVCQCVICVDDIESRNALHACDVPVLTYGIKNPSDVFAIDLCCTMDGAHFVANVCDSVMEIKTNLIGQYNVENALATLAVCKLLGLDEKQLCEGLGYVLPAEGRFNVINFSGKYVVIDFAHSPDGLEKVLQTAKQLAEGKVFVVFGCGGNRDKLKRSKMGEIAEKLADVVCLTDDNPRFEKSEDIIADIETGMKSAHFVVPRRAEAICKMIESAAVGDIIVVAGKGAEKFQEVNGQKYPFNDFDVVYGHFKQSDPIFNRGKEW